MKTIKFAILALCISLSSTGCGQEGSSANVGASPQMNIVVVQKSADWLHGLKTIKIVGPLIEDEAATGIDGNEILNGLLAAFKKIGVPAEKFDLNSSDNPDNERFFMLEVTTMGGQKARGVYFYDVCLSLVENAYVKRGDVFARNPIDLKEYTMKGTLGASELEKLKMDIMDVVAKSVKADMDVAKPIK